MWAKLRFAECRVSDVERLQSRHVVWPFFFLSSFLFHAYINITSPQFPMGPSQMIDRIILVDRFLIAEFLTKIGWPILSVFHVAEIFSVGGGKVPSNQLDHIRDSCDFFLFFFSLISYFQPYSDRFLIGYFFSYIQTRFKFYDPFLPIISCIHSSGLHRYHVNVPMSSPLTFWIYS